MVEQGQPEIPRKKNFDSPDEVVSFDLGQSEQIVIGTTTFMRRTFQPGWRWSTSLKDKADTNSCEDPHALFHIAGKMHIKMDNGAEEEFAPGDAGIIPAGHDKWVEGEEPVILLEVKQQTEYTKFEIEEETKAIKKRGEDFIAAMNTHDIENITGFFTNDAEFTNTVGITICGRESIGNYIELLLNKFYTNSSFRITNGRIRLLQPNIAIANMHLDTVDTAVDLADADHPIEANNSLIALVLTKKDRWNICMAYGMGLIQSENPT